MASPPGHQRADSPSSTPIPSGATTTTTTTTTTTAAATRSNNDEEIPSRSPSPDLPLTMTASLVLTALPRDATAALAHANDALFPADHKIVVRFKPVGGSAPPLPQKRELSRISAGQKFEVVVGYLNRVLRLQDKDGGGANNGKSVFCYVNATFAPALDEVVGNLWRVSLFGCSYVWEGRSLF